LRKRYIVTGAPGSGKTSIIQALQSRGYDVVEEAATAVIAAEQAQGNDEPWAQPAFIDKIVSLQRQRQTQSVLSGSEVQIFDRSPVCTLALSAYLGLPVPASLSEEIERIRREAIYDRNVIFVRDIGFIEPTKARRITFADSVEFERVHVQTYRTLGYDLVDVPRAAVADRTDIVEAYLDSWK
jgi:predicted ATPase